MLDEGLGIQGVYEASYVYHPSYSYEFVYNRLVSKRVQGVWYIRSPPAWCHLLQEK